MRQLNGRSSPNLPAAGLDSILYTLGTTTGRIEEKIDHLTDRIEKVETRLESSPAPRRPLSDYLPAIYGLAILIGVAMGKWTVVQGLAFLGR
jgi:hypothetical protein